MSELRSLKRITSLFSRGASPNYADGGEANFINQACIYRDGIKMTAIKKANKSSHPSGSRGYLNKGDLLINSTGRGTLGRVTIFDIENNGTYFADSHVTIVRPDTTKVNSSYLKYIIGSSKFQDEIYTTCVTGSTNQIELSRENLRELSVPVPSLENQQKIVDSLNTRLAKIDKADETLQKSISQLEEYRISLISNVITGKVEV